MSEYFTLYIGAYSPRTIPMSRLTEYMKNFATILGSEKAVHFEMLKEGSTQVVAKVDDAQIEEVGSHLIQVSGASQPNRQMEAVLKRMNKMLEEDETSGFIYRGDDVSAQVIQFPGAKRLKSKVIGPISQFSHVDGELISISGADSSVHIQLINRKQKYTNIVCDRDMARQLAKHMYEYVRLSGQAKWIRDEQEAWKLHQLKVSEYEVLSDSSLSSIYTKLQEMGANEWSEIENPVAFLKDLRSDGGGEQ